MVGAGEVREMPREGLCSGPSEAKPEGDGFESSGTEKRNDMKARQRMLSTRPRKTRTYLSPSALQIQARGSGYNREIGRSLKGTGNGRRSLMSPPTVTRELSQIHHPTDTVRNQLAPVSTS